MPQLSSQLKTDPLIWYHQQENNVWPNKVTYYCTAEWSFHAVFVVFVRGAPVSPAYIKNRHTGQMRRLELVWRLPTAPKRCAEDMDLP